MDQRIIEYAVKTKYPQIEGFGVSSDYIEKIIQLPIKIPELSSKDIENYLLLLICQLHLDEESFETLISKIYEKRIMLGDKVITYLDVDEIIQNIDGKYRVGSDKVNFKNDADIIAKISHAVSGSLKGNPRQAKRFLNTFFVRKNLASLYFEKEIDISILAKLLALETIDIRAFRKLYEWNSDYDGEIKQLKEIEYSIKNDKEIGEDYSLWNNPRIIRWAKSEPTELYKQDLSKYFYLSREALSSTESVESSFDEVERKMLAAILNCIMGQEDLRLEELKKMEPTSQRNICDAVLLHFKSDTVSLSIVSRIYKEYPECQKDIIDIFAQKPKTFFALSAIPHLIRMYKSNSVQMETLLNDLEKRKIITTGMKSQITNSDFAATAVKRR